MKPTSAPTSHTPALHLAAYLIAGSIALAIPANPVNAAGTNLNLQGHHYTAPSFANTAPLKLKVYENGNFKEYQVRPTPDGLEVIIDPQGASIVYPWNSLGKIQFIYDISANLREHISDPDPKRRAVHLAHDAKRLLPLAGIPEVNTNIHELIAAYVSAQIESGPIDTAYQLSQQIDLARAPASISSQFYRVTEILYAQGKDQQAQHLLNQLYAARPKEEFHNSSLGLARSLAEQRHYESALNLYRPLMELSSSEERKAIALRCAFLSLETSNDADYKYFSDIATSASGETPTTEATALLIRGIKALNENDTRSALKALGHALAIVPADSQWKEIALYYNFKTYQQQGDTEIAQTILDEMKLLFPEGAYTASLPASTN